MTAVSDTIEIWKAFVFWRFQCVIYENTKLIWLTVCIDVINILRMCMWLFAEEKIISDKITAFSTLTVLRLGSNFWQNYCNLDFEISDISQCVGGSWVGMGQVVGTGVGHGGITCVLQTKFSSFFCLACKAEARHRYWLSCGVISGSSVGGVNFWLHLVEGTWMHQK